MNPMRISDLQTPALLVDPTRLQRNLDGMRSRMSALGVVLRPHVKTAKSARIATLACGGSPGPITVSTLREAEHFADHGFDDMTYAVGVVAAKLERAAALLAKGVELTLLLDSVEAARAVATRASALGVTFGVLIEIDTGDGRGGVASDDATLLEVARLLDSAPGVQLRGVLTHAGQAYACDTVEQIRRVAATERDGVVGAARRLREAGLPCPVVSAGSTPTAVHAKELAGLTEMRPGNYVFFDLTQLALGSCRPDALALSILASVIGHNRRRGRLILDAGALALSKDTGVERGPARAGYGLVCGVAELENYPGLVVREVSQEHGLVPVDDAGLFDRLPIGARVRVLPNHACLTAAAYTHYHVVEGDRVVDQWDRVTGW